MSNVTWREPVSIGRHADLPELEIADRLPFGGDRATRTRKACRLVRKPGDRREQPLADMWLGWCEQNLLVAKATVGRDRDCGAN